MLLQYLFLKIFGFYEIPHPFFEIGRIRFGSGSVKIFPKGSGSVRFSRIRAALIFINKLSLENVNFPKQ